LLEVRGWRGHFLVPTDFIGKASFLSAEQIRLLHSRGHVIGSHSCSHPRHMAHCSWDQLVSEWSRSCAILSEILGEPLTVASVPNGSYSRRVAEAAALAGIRVLFNSEPTTRARQVHDCFVVGRYSIDARTSAASAVHLVSGRPWRRLHQAVAWNLKKVVKALGGRG
jgi:peptidoglycan/xylan/chitin deacetylase (PgdA/CDA1 family)